MIIPKINNTNIIFIIQEKNKKRAFHNGLLDACIFRLLNKDTEKYFIELIDLIKDVNIPSG